MTNLNSKELLEGVTPDHDWIVSPEDDYFIIAYPEGIATIIADLDPIGQRTALEMDANARLIAEAPRLARRVIELEEGLVKAQRALQRMMDTWLDYHDAHSLTQPVTGASANAFDDALEARDLCAALTIQGEG